MRQLLRLAAVAGALLPAAPAHADKGLVVALYLPDTPLSLQQLADLGESLARQLASALGTSVVARSYRKDDDFATVLRDGTADLALCEPLLVAARALRVVGVATRAGPPDGERTTTQLALYGARPLLGLLAGRGSSTDHPLRLAGVRSTRHRQLVQRVLLEGDPGAARALQWLAAPDVLSSLEVVRSGRADIAMAPFGMRGAPAGLLAHPLGAPVPNPALVALSPRAIALEDRLRAVLPQLRLDGPLSGLRAGTARPYQALAAELAGEAPGQHRVALLPNPRPPMPTFSPSAHAPLGPARVSLPLPPAGALVGF